MIGNVKVLKEAMPSVLVSVHPEFCELIAAREKTEEIRKTVPKLETPFKCFIYKTQSGGCPGTTLIEKVKHYNSIGKVIGEFVCDKIDTFEMEGYDPDVNVYQSISRVEFDELTNDKYLYTVATNEASDDLLSQIGLLKSSCLTFDEIGEYVAGSKEFGFHTFYGWHISELVIYDKPRELSEFLSIEALDYDDWLRNVYTGTGIETKYYDSYLKAYQISRPPQDWRYVKEACIYESTGQV